MPLPILLMDGWGGDDDVGDDDVGDDYVGDDDDRSDDDGDGYVCGGSKKRGQRPAAAGVSPKCN